MSDAKQDSGCATFAAIGAAVVAFVSFASCISAGPRKPEDDSNKAQAGRMSEEFVKDRLKAPASASFPNSFDMAVTYQGNSTYTVTSYCDSENSFGAKMRVDYTCKLQKVGGQWKLLDLQTKQRE